MAVDKFVLAEALTALLGVTVKLQSQVSDSDGAVKLDVTNLPTIALLGYEAVELLLSPVSYLASLLAGWFIGDQSQTSQETPKKENASSLTKTLFVIPDEFFDPAYNFDFTHKSKSDADSDCKRGDESYARPYGWKRFGLKVLNKYPDGNTWLGTLGWRSTSDPGEWPVSYHGTGLEGAENIVKTHYKAGAREAYGRGIYSTPDLEVAHGYAQSKQFTSQKNGKTYKVIMQNRVNPKKRKIIEGKNHWLVPIPEGTSPAKEKEIVESSIRPYGLLLKEV
ncbi:hypothetical protein E1301_Tti023347 [Triplophysa tibetana]|uniref:Uncharacterized protein n=1 Tax=Triplophysa tibetana TaxID=1572043 RepID=A0A5A9NSL8_9TELE|nr:hypothetical protein E1301_Tti023347 [Triplophysa tibetana]